MTPAVLVCITAASMVCQITKPDDAPQPLSPLESAARVTLPDGFRLELIASEPLIEQPSGVCWDASGRMFVCELHGYNMEGQYDIEQLNKTGELDTQVRRIAAPAEAVARAAKDQIGKVKLLTDTNADGIMDQAQIWADDLPACFGLVPYKDGVIVVCAPDIVFLADRDDDGHAEVRQTLYTGFPEGVLERRINTPKWGLDGWIYVGRGGRCKVTGPSLSSPVSLPSTDFRIRPDGTAIEPVTGGTHTIGYTFDKFGDRFVATTVSPGKRIAPLAWRYLARNPSMKTPRLDEHAAAYRTVFPTSRPHPWRSKRAGHKAFYEFYRKRYGASESVAGGYFTSACGPMIYRDHALPGLRDNYFVCEPAGNLIHRAVMTRDGTDRHLTRHAEEQSAEFLASSDIWFHPIALSHSPDGTITIIDFYREIIEDYSAIPRYLQQQYGLEAGKHHGRIWRLTHRDRPLRSDATMSNLSTADLMDEVASTLHWRRETARRLLTTTHRHLVQQAADKLPTLISRSPEAAINALHTLAELNRLTSTTLVAALDNASPAVRRHALELSEPLLDRSPDLLKAVIARSSDTDPRVLLQLAFTLGESDSRAASDVLSAISKEHGSIRWMPQAVESSMSASESVPDGDRPSTESLVEQAKSVLAQSGQSSNEHMLVAKFKSFTDALTARRDVANGERLFRQSCAACHQVQGIGQNVGPDLTAEKNRSEETFVKDILAPSSTITAGYVTTIVESKKGLSYAGLLVGETPGSLSLKDMGGTTHVIPRSGIKTIKTLNVSLMPNGLADVLGPKGVADVIAWIRSK